MPQSWAPTGGNRATLTRWAVPVMPISSGPKHCGSALLLTLTNGFIDAYTYFTRGECSRTSRPATSSCSPSTSRKRNSPPRWPYLWSLLAFIIGIALASHIKSGRAERLVPRPLLWTMAVQAVALLIIGFVPLSVPNSLRTIPICFLAAVQIGLFRNIGELACFPVATTGNLMRFVEAGYDGFVESPRIRGVLSPSTAPSSPRSPKRCGDRRLPAVPGLRTRSGCRPAVWPSPAC